MGKALSHFLRPELSGIGFFRLPYTVSFGSDVPSLKVSVLVGVVLGYPISVLESSFCEQVAPVSVSKSA